MKEYFIMMNNQKGTHISPIVDDDEEVCLFESEEEAEMCVRDNPYAQACGYEIFKMSNGEAIG
jgi:hypothetical protein